MEKHIWKLKINKGGSFEKIVIFGIGDNGELAKYYFENDEKYKNEYKIIAFTIDKKFKKEEQFLGSPLVKFEKLEKIYLSNEYYLFNTISYSKMNTLREEKLKEIKRKKYKTMNYISSKACVSIKDIGENNFIIDNSVIQPFVKLGSNIVVMGGGLIGHHSVVGDNCFIGINSTVSHSVTLKYKTLVGGGAWISKDTEEYGIYVSEISRKIGKKSIDIKI